MSISSQGSGTIPSAAKAAPRRRLFRFYAGRDFMRLSGYRVSLVLLPRPDIMGPQYGYPYDEGRLILCWLFVEVRIPWPLISFSAHSDAPEIRFREGVRAMQRERDQ